jgi:hypothetical protein
MSRWGLSHAEGVRTGSLLVAPEEAGARARDVVLVFDEDRGEPGFYGLVLTRPLEQPAQPLTFGLFDAEDQHAWWGGPTSDVFALVEIGEARTRDDTHRPNDQPRRYVTANTGVWVPGRDHPPSAVTRAGVFVGSIWLSTDETDRCLREGTMITATEEMLFDADPETLAQQLQQATPP